MESRLSNTIEIKGVGFKMSLGPVHIAPMFFLNKRIPIIGEFHWDIDPAPPCMSWKMAPKTQSTFNRSRALNYVYDHIIESNANCKVDL